MGKSPRFTVLLPTHNRADVIEYAIRSVLAQTDPDFELLIVGDGCTDGTAAVVAEFHDSRIRWFDLPKAPHFGYANRNVALREARGALVAFAAHDDLLLPDHLERMAQPFQNDLIDWAYSRPVWVSDDGVMVPFAVDLRQPAQLEHFLNVGNSIPASCVVYRATCVQRFGEWPEQVPHSGDWVYWKAIVGPARGANLAYVPAATCLHFRAVWRASPRWGPDPLDPWLFVANDSPWWPAGLRVEVGEGTSPQAAVWQEMAADSRGWSIRLRSAVTEAMDILAWSAGTIAPMLLRHLLAAMEELTRVGSQTVTIALAEPLLRIVPADGRIHSAQGAALLAAGELAAAREAFRRAIELEPGVAQYHARLALSLLRLGCFDEAEVAALESLRLDPTLSVAANLLGEVGRRRDAGACRRVTRRFRRRRGVA